MLSGGFGPLGVADEPFLTRVPDDRVAAFSEAIAPAALANATHDGRLTAVPWFLDPQVLWYRGNAAERAGLDPSQPISWDDLIAAAQRLGVTIQIEDRDGSGLAEWINGLIAGGGGTLVDGQGRSARAGLTSDAGRAAASIVEFYSQAGVGPGPSQDALRRFASADGAFLIASTSAIADPVLAAVQADMAAAPYPVVGNASVAPLAGVELAVPAAATHPKASFAAIACLTSGPSLQQIMSGPQHSASLTTTYDDPGVKAAFRGGEIARAAVTTGMTVPATPLWPVIADALNETWLPVADVNQAATSDEAQRAVQAAIDGRLP
jgi:multiple sugar transport system substrate-binding protein